MTNWTERELKYIIEHWAVESAEFIAERLRKEEAEVIKKARSLNLKKRPPYNPIQITERSDLTVEPRDREWKEEDKAYLRQNYSRMSYSALNKRLKRTEKAIREMAHKMLLERDSSQIIIPKRRA